MVTSISASSRSMTRTGACVVGTSASRGRSQIGRLVPAYSGPWMGIQVEHVFRRHLASFATTGNRIWIIMAYACVDFSFTHGHGNKRAPGGMQLPLLPDVGK